MDKSMLKGIAAGAAAVVAIGGIAGYEVSHRQPAYADVLKTEPVLETVKTPRQVCKDEAVTRKAPVQDRERIAGTAIGAVAGGVLGHQIGGGSGRTVATVGGAALGGYAGNQIQKNLQNSDTETTRQTRCKTVYDRTEKLLGYKVTYRLGDTVSTTQLAYLPGDRIPIKDGKLVLNPPVVKK